MPPARKRAQGSRGGGGYLPNQRTASRDTVLGLIIVVVVGAGLIAAVIFVVRAVAAYLTQASPQLSSALVGTAGLVFVAVIANFLAKIYEQRQQLQEEQRAKKVEVYSEFMAFWIKLLTSGSEEDEEDSEDPETQAEIQRYLQDFTYKLVAWGSEPLIREYGVFKELIQRGETATAILYFENVLREIRRDIGYKNKNLNKGDLLKVFVSSPDIDAAIAAADVQKQEDDGGNLPSENASNQ